MIAWATQSAFATSALILVVLLIRRPVSATFGASAAYALWLAPAARAILPSSAIPQVDVPTPSIPAAPGDYQIFVQAAPDGVNWISAAVVVWLGGALAYLLFHWWRHQQFLSDALDSGRAVNAPQIPYDVVASPMVDGPLATGLVHPLILVPEDFEQRFTPEQQRLALLHEQSHHHRGDIWASLAAMLITAFLWFNPFAHMALRAFRRDMEAACDARVLANAGAGTAKPYAETILRSVSRPAPRSLCALTAVDELKGRLMMLNTTHGPGRKLAGLIIAAGLTAGGMVLTAPAIAHDGKDAGSHEVRRIEIREVKGGKDVVMKRDGREVEIAAKCPGEKVEISSEGSSDARKENVRLVLCTKPGENMVAALEKAAADFEKRDEISADHKAEMIAKIRAKIAELRAKG